MTRKHFQALADAIRAVDVSPPDRLRLIDAIGDVCAAQNPRFDWGRFRVACTPPDTISLAREVRCASCLDVPGKDGLGRTCKTCFGSGKVMVVPR